VVIARFSQEESMNHLLRVVAAALATSVLCVVVGADEKREEKPRFKGVELYSWKEKGGDWVFALLDGTNRLKTEEEVKAARNQIRGAAELKKRLARLAVGEQVLWTHPIEGFAFPPEAIRKEIEKAAKDSQIDLMAVGQE
jgi:hypothetical protein